MIESMKAVARHAGGSRKTFTIAYAIKRRCREQLLVMSGPPVRIDIDKLTNFKFFNKSVGNKDTRIYK